MKSYGLALLALLSGCEGSHPSGPSSVREAAQINAECKSGRISGHECEMASRRLENAEHRDAQSAFEKMTEN